MMKTKLYSFIVSAALLFVAADANAEGFVIKGGLAFQNLNSGVEALKNASFKTKLGWTAGIGYQTATWGGFSLQPEVLYRSKSIETVAFDQTLVTTTSSFIELPVNVQWGIDLLMLRPFVFASPYVGFNIGNKISGISETITTNKVTGGVGLGLGLEISKLQITAKYNWDFGGVANWNDYWSHMGDQFKNLKLKEGSFHIGLAFIF